MVFVSLLVAPVVVLTAVTLEQRRGAAAGGWVAALPLSSPVALLAVSLDSGPHVAARLAWSAGAHVAAQVAFAVALAAALRRVGLARGLASGVAAYAAVSLLIAGAPIPFAVAAAVPALLLARRLIPAQAAPASARRRPATTALTCLGAPAVVAAAVFGSRWAGPEIGGALAAFPTVSCLLSLAIARHGGGAAGVQALAGLVRGLPCYLAFYVLVAATLPLLGTGAVPLALLACLAAGRVTWRGLPELATA